MPIDIQLRSDSLVSVEADVLVVGLAQTGGKSGGLPSALRPIEEAMQGSLARLVAKEEYQGKRDQTLSVSTLGCIAAERLILLGLGDRRKVSAPDLRTFGARAARLANVEKAKSLAVSVPAGLDADLRPIVEGIELGAYRFTKYFTGDRQPKVDLARATILTNAKRSKAALAVGQSVAIAVNRSRDWSNEPGNVIYPESFAAEAEKLAKQNRLDLEIFDAKEIRRRGMKLIDAVGRGSAREPRFVHIAWTPKGARRKLVFVGKGVTFDSGGISIKPAAGMGDMKHDMSGAANVIALMGAVAALKPRVEVHAIAACAENMPDGNAYRPGDIWGSLDGKTVEIVNTDAEGRLVLADALAYARTLTPDVIIDNATLTGACVVALGNTCSGWYANQESAANEFVAALKQSGETMWRMPLIEELREQIKSDVADVKQAGDRHGGSITAALFLREFVGDVPWIHCDIAGPSYVDRPSGWSQVKGATGHGLLTFLAMIERAARP
jgi:leucyl aminopeptidase